MVSRLISFALVVIKLLMHKVCEVIGISKIKFLIFSCTEMVKQNQKNSKLVSKSVLKKFRQIPNMFLVFH